MNSGDMVLDTIINLGQGHRILRLRHGLEELLCRFVNIEAFGTALELDNTSVSVDNDGILDARIVCHTVFIDHVAETKDVSHHVWVIPRFAKA